MTQANQRNDRILVIDDNPAIHDDFRKILSGVKPAEVELAAAETVLFGGPAHPPKALNFQIDSAFQGDEGLALVQKAVASGRPYALAFVDVRMPPGWDGVETITRVWQIDPELQIVICTAYADYSWTDINQNFGRSDSLVILKKPFDNIEVLQLAHALAKKWAVTQQAKVRLSDLQEMVRARTQELEGANEALKQEIRERVQAEEALRLSEERFSKAFQASPIPMAIQTLEEERYVDVNDRFLQMTGFHREEVIGRTPAELNLCVDSEVRGKMFERLRHENSVRGFECRMRTKSNEVRQTLVSLEVFHLRQKPHLLAITEDISERLRLENQLRQAQKMEAVGKLAAGIAHDFNNILTIIQGYSSLGLTNLDLDDDLRVSLNEILNAAVRAATLTRQLLAFSRRQLMQPEVFHLNELVRGLTDLFGRMIGERINLKTELAQPLPAIYADPGNIEQAITNLVLNARDAMPDGGELAIRTGLVAVDEDYLKRFPEARVGRFVCLSVSDTGCGMDAALQSRLFEPFFTTKEVGKGTGMGLAMVYGIVKQHDGWIEVASQVGQGSTFKIYLPACDTEAESIRAERPIPARPSRGKEAILVVEDEARILELVQKVLQMEGYHVVTARNGMEALPLWQQLDRRIDLLLTDVVMPGGLTGRDLAERLSAEKPELKVIYTSGYSLQVLGPEFVLKEGLNFLQKPYQAQLLVTTVRHCLDASPQAWARLTASAKTSCGN